MTTATSSGVMMWQPGKRTTWRLGELGGGKLEEVWGELGVFWGEVQGMSKAKRII